MTKRLLSVLFMMLSMLVGCGGERPQGIGAGDDLPAFTMQSLSGSRVDSTALRGKWLVLNVWATWCGPCRKELPSLQRLANTLGDKNWQVVGLALETDAHAVREYLAEKEIRYANFLDAGAKIDKEILGLTVLPTTYIVDPEGKVRDVVIGDRDWSADEMLQRLYSLSKSKSGVF